MNKQRNIKFLMITSGVLLVLSLIAAAGALSKPTKLQRNIALVNYAQNGQFNYTVYLKPSHLYGPAPETTATIAEFPEAVVDTIAFSYNFLPAAAATSGIARIEAVLENPGIWQKTLVLVPDTATNGDFTFNFSLNLPQISQIFKQIESGINISSSTQNVTINAYFQTGSNINVQTLPLTIEGNLLKIPLTLSSTQDAGSGVFTYSINPIVPATQTTDITYPSFNLTGQQPVATPIAPIILDPGQPDFINLIDKMNVNFAYQFQSDRPVENLNINVDAVATLTAAQSWSKNIDLLQTTENGNFNLAFPLDMAGYTKLIQSINTETGVAPSSYNLTITMNIHATGKTAFGPIDETFSPSLNGTIIGNVLNWTQTQTNSKTGAINQASTINNKYFGLPVVTARIIFILLIILFLIILLGLYLSYSKYRKPEFSGFDREIQKIQKSYGIRIADANGNSLINDKNPVSMNSIEDLIKIADELGKPVVHQSGGSLGNDHLYYIIDGDTRYQYSLSGAKSASAAKT